uniref:Uncharacterized protein n=1 Tax=Steinernema glaseri TaxID=37863 RepID=A0A1I7ZG45_9BILA
MSDSEFNVNEGVPPDDAVNDRTLSEEPNYDAVGQHTADLSDVSENEDEIHAASTHGGHLSTWFRRISPLVRNKRVRYFAILNFLLTLMNLVLFSVTLGFFAWFISMQVTVSRALNQNQPCLYVWSDWTECTGKCSTRSNDGKIIFPTRTRHVIADKVVHTRGNMYDKCPDNVEKMTETVPCNTPVCATNLSSYTVWSNCSYNDPLVGKRGGCYRIRLMPRENYYVHIDTAELTQQCDDKDCPAYIV